MFNFREAKIEELCLALAQLAHQLDIDAEKHEGKCILTFSVDSGELDAALHRVRGD